MSRPAPAANPRLARVLAAALLIGLIVALWFLPLREWLNAAASYVAENPVAGAAAYLAAAVVAGLAMTPGWVPMMLAGFLFGLVQGFLLAVAGIVLGSAAGFLAGRGLLRGWVERRVAGSRRLRALDRAVDSRGFTIVLLTRLALLLPYNLLNYFYGLTRVRLGTFVAATGLGMLPIIALYVYLGSLARNLGELLEQDRTPDAARWLIAAVALVAITAVTVVIHRAARRALAEEMDDSETDTTQADHNQADHNEESD